MCWNLRNCLTFSWGSRNWTFRRLASSKNAGIGPGPRTSDDATTDGTASEIGRLTSIAGALSGFPGSPATQIVPPSGLTGWSFLKLSISRCCFFHFEQFSPLAHLWGLGISCSIPTMETDSRGVMTSCFLCRLLELLRTLDSPPDSQSWDWSLLSCLDGRRNCGCRTSVQGVIASSMGVGGFGEPGALPRRTCISFQTFVRCPKEGISSSLRSSNFKVISIAPEMSFSLNFSTIEGSNPASCIHLATCLGVHSDTSLKSKLSTASVSVLRCRWRIGISGTLGASSAALCTLDGLGVIGDIARTYSSSASIDESTELLNKCGPLGPSTAFLTVAKSKLKPWNSWESGLGVCTSSKEDNVVSLLLDICSSNVSSCYYGTKWALTEFTLRRGELSSGSLISSSKSVSNSVAFEIGRGASAFMLKNESVVCPLWNISTRGSMGVAGE
jgi:hypothetical protein